MDQKPIEESICELRKELEKLRKEQGAEKMQDPAGMFAALADSGILQTMLPGIESSALQFRAEMDRAREEQQKKEACYRALPADELQNLADDELLEAVIARIQDKMDPFENLSDGIDALNDEERIVYAVNELDQEVNNGGLCQFFVNSSRIAAPMVSACMGAIGAVEHKKLYDDFIDKNGIRYQELASLGPASVEKFQKLYKRYPFREYDDAFSEIKPLREFLTAFIRENISCF